LDGGVELARFTKEQKKISEAMKLLIDLYYRFLETGQKDWFSDETIQLMARIFDLTIPNFSPCLYIQNSLTFRFRGRDEKIRISKFMVKDFKTFMNLIHTDISKGIRSFFRISERIVRTHERTNINALSYVEEIESFEHSKTKNMPLCKIIQPIPEEADTETLSEYLATINMALNEPPNEYESFHLSLISDCALNEEFFLERDNMISCPGYIKPNISLTKTVKYLLVKYQFLFGSFERVKICKQCSKFFFEKKLGAKEYCNGTCRKKHHDSLCPREKRLCLGRQNAWIKYREVNDFWSKVFNVQKDDCLYCTNYVKGGKCPVLIKKNKRNFEKFLKPS
jgi:hypothetical protein